MSLTTIILEVHSTITYFYFYFSCFLLFVIVTVVVAAVLDDDSWWNITEVTSASYYRWLKFLERPTGCGNIVNLDVIQSIAQLQMLAQLFGL
jgi:hypothetical protein